MSRKPGSKGCASPVWVLLSLLAVAAWSAAAAAELTAPDGEGGIYVVRESFHGTPSFEVAEASGKSYLIETVHLLHFASTGAPHAGWPAAGLPITIGMVR
jgi:hypothetical protein